MTEIKSPAGEAARSGQGKIVSIQNNNSANRIDCQELTNAAMEVIMSRGVLPLYNSFEHARPAKKISLSELVRMVQNPRIGPKDNTTPALTPFDGDGKTKDISQISLYYALLIDHDHDDKASDGIKAIYDPYGIAFLAFTTSSHQRDGKKSRWKVLIPFSEPIGFALWVEIARGATLMTGTDLAQARAQQIFYAPNKLAPDAPYEFIIHLDRPFIDPTEFHPFITECLTAYTKDREAKQAQAEAAIPKPRALNGYDGDIIQKINQAFRMDDILQAAGYILKGKKYLSPQSASGDPGVIILNRDGKETVYSHHGATDPLSNLNHGGHALDILDALTILRYGGDLSRAIRELAPQVDPEGQKQRQKEYSENRSTAAAIGTKLCLYPKGTEEDTWEAPIPLKEDTAPRLDPSLLTGIIGDMARAVSAETETPIELATGLILSVLGTACQGKFIVKIKPGYQEPVNIWVVVALDPANRKSSVLIKMTKPLSQFEQAKKNQMEPLIKEAISKRQNQEARIKSLRASYGKAEPEDLKKIENEILEIERDMVEIPVCPKVWTQDVTPEHLGTLLNHHNEKMSILSAEGGIFDIIGGRYSNGVANLDLFLQSHSGDPVRVDRGSREPVFLDNPCLTLGLSPQPEVLRGLADKPGFRGKGLLARFLYFLPSSNLGYRGLDSNPVPEAIKTAYHDLVYKLLEIEPGEDEHGKQQPLILNLSGLAYQEWADFWRTVEKDLRERGRFEHITDWAGKLPGAAARLAGLLHCANNPDQPWTLDISLETMTTALELAATFADHALIAFGLMGADRSIEDAQKVWRWIEQGRREFFTKRDCFDALKGTFHRVLNLEEPLKVLIERQHIREIPQEKRVGKPSIKYEVNPDFVKEWSK